MAQSQYSLSWEDHPKNISNGLSSLQQNGEFVDMTLVADGHLVKVHQVIIALSSSFLKELINSAQCPHPVIVLNKISHTTLSAILEYIYTGEVLVDIEDIRDLIDAAKELHIKGLQDMDLSVTRANQCPVEHAAPDATCEDMEEDGPYIVINKQISHTGDLYDEETENVAVNETESILRRSSDCDNMFEVRPSAATVASTPLVRGLKGATVLTDTNLEKPPSTIQYTISTHGSLQLILNRFVYFLKNTRLDHSRQWRCVDYLTPTKCPAVVFTKDNMVMQRIKAHKHPFHDKRILKKVRANNVFSEILEAEQSGLVRKSLEPIVYIQNE